MNRTKWMLLAIGAALTLSACDTMRVRSDSDAASSVSSCHTYSWLETPVSAPKPTAFENPINDKRLRGAIAKRLASRGIAAAEPGATSDCLVGYAIGSRQNIVDNSASRWSFGLGTGYGGWGSRSAASIGWSTEPYAYREGRIAVDLYRTAGREPIWHAAADVDVSQLTGANAETRIDSVVAAIFDRYPGGARK
jgi:hypothetical protein